MTTRSKKLKVALIGSGETAITLLQNLAESSRCRLAGFASESKTGEAVNFAKQLGIKLLPDVAALLKIKDLDLIINASTAARVKNQIKKLHLNGTEMLDGSAADLFVQLAKDREKMARQAVTLMKSQASKKKPSSKKVVSGNKLQREPLELRLLRETSRKFSESAFDPEDISASLFSAFKKRIPFDVYALMLVEGGRQKLFLSSDRPIPKKLRDFIYARILLDFASQVRVPIDRKDDNVKELYVDKKAARAKPLPVSISSMHTAPLTVQDRTIGMMSLIFCHEYSLRPEEESFFNILASQVALSVENDRIKDAITRERNRLASILESMTNGVLVVDEQQKIILTNPRAAQLLDMDPKQSAGRHVRLAVPYEGVSKLYDSIAAEQREYLTSDVQIEDRKTGRPVVLKINMAKVRDHHGVSIGTVSVFDDKTQEKEVDRMKSEFVSTTSHELRTPLASIREAVALIFEEAAGRVSNDQKKFLSIAQRNIDRLAALINDLLDVSKIESGRMTLQMTSLDLNDVVREVISTFELVARDKDIKIIGELSEQPLLLQGDHDRIIQVMANLLSNALKFTSTGGKVTVITEMYQKEAGFVMVKVKDNGVGIDTDDMSKLFQRFRQVDSSMTRKVGGTGLGLAICKDLISLHGGAIWGESKKSKGSTFTFVLPIKQKRGLSKAKKILIIDDSQDYRTKVKRFLESRGYVIVEAVDGYDGMAKVKREHPDLILLDLIMPKMTGFAVCKKLKSNASTASIPVIVFSRVERQEAVNEALATGADGFLVKSSKPEAILVTIKEFLQ